MALPTRRLTRRALDVALNDWSPSIYTNPPQSMVDEVGYLQLAHKESYTLNLGVTFKNLDMIIKGNSASVINNIYVPDTPVFFGDNDYTNMQAISSITNVSVNQGGSSNQDCMLLEVPDASGFASGDTFRVGSEDKISSSDPSKNERKGEHGTVWAIDTTTTPHRIWTKSPFYETYTTNPRIWRMSWERKLEITNLNMDCVRGAPNTANSPMLKIRGYKAGYISNARTNYSYSEFIRLEGCMMVSTFGCAAENLQTSTTLYRTGYAVVDYSGTQNSHHGLRGQNLRHVFTTGVVGAPTAGTNAAWSFGRTYKFYVNGKGINTHSNAFDSHPDGMGGIFDNCEGKWSSRGVAGSQHVIGLNGIGHTVNNAVAEGGAGGFAIVTDYDHPDNSRGHRINGFKYIPDASGQGLATAIDISGGVDSGTGLPTAGRVTDIIFRDVDLGGAAQTTQLINIQNAEVTFVGGTIKAPIAGSASTGRVWELNYGADVTVERVTTDFTGATASGIRAAILKDDSTGSVAPSKFKYNDCRHISGGLIQYLADGKSKAGEVTVDNLDTDVAPTGSTSGGITSYIANASALTAKVVDFKVKRGRAGNRSVIPLASTNTWASGAKTIDIGDCGGALVVVTVKTTGAGVTVTDITAGNIEGQQLWILLDATSTNTFAYVAGNKIAAASTQAVSGVARFVWSSAANKWFGGV